MASSLDCGCQCTGLLRTDVQTDAIDLRTKLRQKVCDSWQQWLPFRRRLPIARLGLACKGPVWPRRSAVNRKFQRHIHTSSAVEH
jgi:hypothetical protein